MKTPCKPGCVCVRCVTVGKAAWLRRATVEPDVARSLTALERATFAVCPHRPPCEFPGSWRCFQRDTLDAEKARRVAAGGAHED